MQTRPRTILGNRLAEIMPPGLTRFFYTVGGADANENAIKLARAVTGKHKILARYRSYHGATHGAMAATGDPRRLAWEPMLMPGVVHFLDPYRYRSTFHKSLQDVSEEQFSRDYLAHLEEIIQYEGAGTIAAILIETVTGTNGVIIPPDGYLEGIRQICDRNGILLIADEVMSGFGRTGTWFAVDHWGVSPDIMTMAKGLTSGYSPLGAVAMREEIANHFYEQVFQSGLTYNAHPISLAAAIAVIDVMRKDHLVERSAEMGALMKGFLAKIKEKHPSVGDTRSIGLFGAIELVRDRVTREPLAAYNSSSDEMKKLSQFLLTNGLYAFIHWNTILLLPPLIINEKQMDEGFSIIDQALEMTDKSCR
jgi:taurine--2-oxoglutarate transaminase